MHSGLIPLKHKFEQSIQVDDDVLGMLYTGSLGRGMTDQYSDLDIEVWVPDNVFEFTHSKIKQLLQYFGELQFVYFMGPAATGFVSSYWYRVDIDLKQYTNLQPIERYATASVIKDTNNVLKELVQNSQVEPVVTMIEQARQKIAEAIDSQIYLALHNARGDQWSAMGEIVGRSGSLYRLLVRLQGYKSFGFLYAEKLLSPAEQDILTQVWPSMPEQQEIRRAAYALWNWTKYVWGKTEEFFETSIEITIDETQFLSAIDGIYTW